MKVPPEIVLKGVETTPFIDELFTARGDLGAVALKKGANGFLAKPFRPDQLVQKIEDTLDAHKTET